MTVRVDLADDPEKFLQTDLLVWAEGRSTLSTDDVLSGIPVDQRFAASDPDRETDPRRYAGVYGVFPISVTVPGPLHTVRQIPVGGLTWVGVHPDERRRGVLTSMIRDHFTRVAAQDWSGLSALHASEPVIYGRFGYGVASLDCKATISRGTTLTAPGLEDAANALRTHLTTAQDDGISDRVRAIADRSARESLGEVVLPASCYRSYAMEDPAALRENEPHRVLFARDGDADVAYAWFRRKPKWENHGPQGVVEVFQLVGTPAGQLALARRLLDLDLTTKVEISGRSRDDILRRWLGTARGTHGPTNDSMWVRLVDVPTAMAARGYASALDLVLEVADDFVTDQGGRWRLQVADDGTGHATRTDAEPDVSLPTQTLAAAYLGDRDLLRDLQAGLIQEHRLGAVAELDAALSMPTAPAAAADF